MRCTHPFMLYGLPNLDRISKDRIGVALWSTGHNMLENAMFSGSGQKTKVAAAS